ncbi:MAG: helix-turn-helix domain-containing protein [Verrucomicrobiia bacterium]
MENRIVSTTSSSVQNPSAVSQKYVRREALAVHLGVCSRTVDRWIKSRVIPFRRVGRVLLFDPVEIDHALATFWRIPAVGEPRMRGHKRSA